MDCLNFADYYNRLNYTSTRSDNQALLCKQARVNCYRHWTAASCGTPYPVTSLTGPHMHLLNSQSETTSSITITFKLLYLLLIFCLLYYCLYYREHLERPRAYCATPFFDTSVWLDLTWACRWLFLSWLNLSIRHSTAISIALVMWCHTELYTYSIIEAAQCRSLCYCHLHIE